ncbi:MAG: CRISPR-associated endonuclease Cas2 [Candidatus Heimdallarchaeaceae archaeon]
MVVEIYVIIVYDVGEERVNRVHKFLKAYLTWTQNSVFEGKITKATLAQIKTGIKRIIKKEVDSIKIFKIKGEQWMNIEIIGVEKNKFQNII